MSDGSYNFSTLVHSIVTSAKTAIQAEWVAVLLPSTDRKWFVTSADTRPDAPFIRLKHNGQVPKWLESQDAVLRSSDPFLGEMAVPFDEWDEAVFEEHGVQLAAPMMQGDQLMGVLLAGSGIAGSAYPVSALNYLKSISEVAGMAIAADAHSDGAKSTRSGEGGSISDDQLLRRMGHDLKGPLATVMTYLDLVRQNKTGNLTDAQIKRIDKATRSGRRLLKLLNDFVDYARLRSGSIGLERTEFELGEIASEISRQMESELANRGQTLRSTVPPSRVTLWADRSRILQVIFALVSNASRYSADGLPVDLELWAERNRLRVRVIDRGRGMSEEQLTTVFEPFNSDQPPAKGEGDQAEAGSGLGLVLARGLTRLHGGELTIQSSAGKGTVAEVEMPVVLAGEGKNTEAA